MKKYTDRPKERKKEIKPGRDTNLGNFPANKDRGDTKSKCQNIREYLEAGEVHLLKQNGESLHVGLTVRWVPHPGGGSD